MKKFLKKYTRYLIGFEVARCLFPGFSYHGGIQTLLLAVLVFSLLQRFLKPVFKLLLLPFNLLTLGFFRWVTDALTFFFVPLIIKNVQLSAWQFNGWEFQGFIIPQIHFPIATAYIFTPLIISLVSHYFLWLNQ
ncbi:phage holin family protein [Patescibacteria group bacterium]|nr:phage holin family protein [Patescibacteria group bacterium]MBU1931626.1 phage holin family protein [Patescibacteria group bacterium]